MTAPSKETAVMILKKQQYVKSEIVEIYFFTVREASGVIEKENTRV